VKLIAFEVILHKPSSDKSRRAAWRNNSIILSRNAQARVVAGFLERHAVGRIARVEVSPAAKFMVEHFCGVPTGAETLCRAGFVKFGLNIVV
jgi:hypothetical protein